MEASTSLGARKTSYYCGPATAQVIDDYHGACIMQGSYAIHMGTTQAGTDSSVVDDELRSQTAKNYQNRQ